MSEKASSWHVVAAGRTIAEETDATLRQRIADGSIVPDTLVWRIGMPDWLPAKEIPGLFTPPPPPDISPNPSPPETERKPPPPLMPLRVTAEDRATYLANQPHSQSTRVHQEIKQSSYILRHWRGELSLGVSYWVNGLLLTLIAATGEVVLDEADITQHPRLITAAYASFSLLLIVVSIWQVVGIWRSAGRTIEERQRQSKTAPWARVARFAAFLGFLSLVGNTAAYRLPNAWANLQIAFGVDAVPHHRLRMLNGGREIELAGGI